MLSILQDDTDEPPVSLPLYSGHDVVNHSKNFKDPKTKKHTNACEGKWNGLKKEIPAKNRNVYQLEEFFTFLKWKDENYHNLWKAFILLLKLVRYTGNTEDQPVQTPLGQGNRKQWR